MKFKIASVLELVIPLLTALMLTAFLGCGGGGGSYGNGIQAYDGTWDLNLKGYELPPPLATSAVTCVELPTTVIIEHGFGKTTEVIDCANSTHQYWDINISVLLTPDDTGLTGKVDAIVTGGAKYSGVCINRVACQGTNLTLIKL